MFDQNKRVGYLKKTPQEEDEKKNHLAKRARQVKASDSETGTS
jgi:hypothetical protein